MRPESGFLRHPALENPSAADQSKESHRSSLPNPHGPKP